jgi:L-alanine-DL-glutamate epimerase-like enolase superfamily enzyme
VRVDTDPYSGATLAETVMANQGDLDEAYHAAAKAQVSWAARLTAERAAVLEEPVAAEDLAGHRAVRERVRPVPIQTGRTGGSLMDANAIAAGASDFAMVDIMKIGGITGWMAAMAQAEAAALPLSNTCNRL